MDIATMKKHVYDAVARGNSLADGYRQLQRAESLGATVSTVEPWPLTRENILQGFRQKTTYRIELPNGEKTSIYWQPARDAKDESTEGSWYGRAAQWD